MRSKLKTRGQYLAAHRQVTLRTVAKRSSPAPRYPTRQPFGQDKRRFFSEARAAPPPISGLMTSSRTLTL
jgi:hypothetical protein